MVLVAVVLGVLFCGVVVLVVLFLVAAVVVALGVLWWVFFFVFRVVWVGGLVIVGEARMVFV